MTQNELEISAFMSKWIKTELIRLNTYQRQDNLDQMVKIVRCNHVYSWSKMTMSQLRKNRGKTFELAIFRYQYMDD